MPPVRKLSIESHEGAGNLDAKAYIASIVGPRRVLFGKHTSVTLTEGTAVQLGKNAGAQTQWGHMTVVLPGNVAGPKVALFSANQSNGFNTAIPVSLQRTTGPGNTFEAVLQPGDMVYARSAPGQGEFKIVVALVWF